MLRQNKVILFDSHLTMPGWSPDGPWQLGIQTKLKNLGYISFATECEDNRLIPEKFNRQIELHKNITHAVIIMNNPYFQCESDILKGLTSKEDIIKQYNDILQAQCKDIIAVSNKHQVNTFFIGGLCSLNTDWFNSSPYASCVLPDISYLDTEHKYPELYLDSQLITAAGEMNDYPDTVKWLADQIEQSDDYRFRSTNFYDGKFHEPTHNNFWEFIEPFVA